MPNSWHTRLLLLALLHLKSGRHKQQFRRLVRLRPMRMARGRQCFVEVVNGTRQDEALERNRSVMRGRSG